MYVIAAIEVKPGMRDAFLAEFRKLVPLVHAEDGCIAYEPTLDLPTGLPPQELNPNVVTIMEQWESVEHLKKHLAQPHMAAYKEATKDMTVGLKLKVLGSAL